MNKRIITLAAILTLAFGSNAFAHCGMCGVGEKKEGAASEKGSAKGHMMESHKCLCGMELKEGSAQHVEHNGKTYHLCSKECAEAFKADPKGSIKSMKEKGSKASHGSEKGSGHDSGSMKGSEKKGY